MSSRAPALALLIAAFQEAPVLSERPREAAVLAVLDRELDGRRGGWFWRSRLVREPATPGAPGEAGGRVVPDIRPTCGNSRGGLLEQESVDALALALAAAYEPGAKAPAIRIDEKLGRIMDGDTFTPLAAVAADVVLQLNESHDGEDVDLSLLLGGTVDAWNLPVAKRADGKLEKSVAGGGVSEFAAAARLLFEVRPGAKGSGSAPRKEPVVVDGPLRSTAGHVALLFFPAYPTSAPPGDRLPSLALRVVQRETRTEARASSSYVWLPSTFDAAKPFEVEATFSPGVWTWGLRVMATATTREP